MTSTSQAPPPSRDTAGCSKCSVVFVLCLTGQQLHQPTCFVMPHRANRQLSGSSLVGIVKDSFPQQSRKSFVFKHLCFSLTSLSASPAANLLAHNNVQLVLHLSMDIGCDGGSQLLGAALKGADELSKLIQQWVPGLLFSCLLVLHVSLELLNVCNSQRGRHFS